MLTVVASAPGKAFVTGEYAVLCGEPAIVMAVRKYLTCRLRVRPGPSELILHGAAGLVHVPLAQETAHGIPSDVRFLAAAGLVAARHLGLHDVSLDWMTSSELDGRHGKLGLGSSGAVTAAAIAAIFGAFRPQEALEASLSIRVALGVQAHRLAQGGGSGADVVASTSGGLVWLSNLEGANFATTVTACVERARASAVSAKRLDALPETLTLELVGTGESASSGPRVARFLARANDPTLQQWARAMGRQGTAFVAACERQDGPGTLLAMQCAGRYLARLGGIAGLPIFRPRLRKACALARAYGAAKPSGAGGGDCAVALVPRPQVLALREDWRRAGLEPLCVELDLAGAALQNDRRESLHA